MQEVVKRKVDKGMKTSGAVKIMCNVDSVNLDVKKEMC